MLIGDAGLARLQAARVAVFGLGGVGGHAAEALVRAGIGAIDLIDSDTVSETNINRQLVALHSTVGHKKTAVLAERLRDVSPAAKITVQDVFFDSTTAPEFEFRAYDYVIDAIDTVSSKLLLIEQCMACSVPILSSMGTGNKFRPELLQITDIYETSGCPLARVMRHELRKRGVQRLTVVYSTEVPATPVADTDEQVNRRSIPGSMSFVPPVAGMLLASRAVRDILGRD